MTPEEIATLVRERDEALAFARSEARRNESLRYQNDTYERRGQRNYEAVRRLRALLKAHGYYGGSYLGVRLAGSPSVMVGDSKYSPAIEIVEEFVTHLLGRIYVLQQAKPAEKDSA